jgi:hypothetical protein
MRKPELYKQFQAIPIVQTVAMVERLGVPDQIRFVRLLSKYLCCPSDELLVEVVDVALGKT